MEVQFTDEVARLRLGAGATFHGEGILAITKALLQSGEDYGEGASVIQERTHAFAMKSTLLLLDPRPSLSHMVDMVEHAFAMSEASNMPAVLQLRIRACHVRGSFICKDNRAPAISTRALIEEPAAFEYSKLAHPPVIYAHEKRKIEHRIPAAQAYIVAQVLNEALPGAHAGVGLIVQGGLYNSLQRALAQLGLADAFGNGALPLLVLNVTYPLVPQQIIDWCAAKSAVLMLEEGQPEYIEKDVLTTLYRAGVATRLHGKDLVQAQGEYTVELLARALLAFCDRYLPGVVAQGPRDWLAAITQRRVDVAALLGTPLPARPPNFCVGCPERPMFSALKLAQQNVGAVHVAADIGCQALATFEPFSSGHSILGYGMSLASRAGGSPLMQRRVLSVMGDGGFWRSGLLTGVQSALFNGDDAVLPIMKNGYTSATGTQDIISTPDDEIKAAATDKQQSLVHKNQTIEATLKGLGVQWLRSVDNYDVSAMRRTLEDAFTEPFSGLKVIIAEGECQLERQRRIRPWIAGLLQRGERVARVKNGVDDDVCTCDHACIRLSGCPTLTLKSNPDPLKLDPVATVIDGCVGCGLCGANAHAATLCPSFYRAELVKNPGRFERWLDGVRGLARRLLQAREQAA